MEIRYGQPTPEQPFPRYFLTADKPDEMRFLTILRDLLEGKPKARLRFIGAELVGKSVPGQPQNPVQIVALALDDPDFTMGGTPAALEKSLDPNRVVGKQARHKVTRPVGRGDGRNTSIVHIVE